MRSAYSESAAEAAKTTAVKCWPTSSKSAGISSYVQSAAGQRDQDPRTEVKLRRRELLLERRDGILVIKINCPQRRNALNRNAVYEMIAALAEATHNKDIQLVVITGVGDIFCAGNDLKQMQDYKNPQDYNRGANYVLRSLVKSIITCPKIVACLVNGPCIGIGFTLAALCSVVYCTKSAYFQTPFTQLGLCPEACSSFTFPQHFGQSWSSKLLLFGEKLTAEKAEQFGFVAEIFEDLREVEEKFWCKMKDLAKLPWDSVSVSKRLIGMQRVPQLLKALDSELKEIEKLRSGPLYQKAIEVFLKKSKSANKSKL